MRAATRNSRDRAGNRALLIASTIVGTCLALFFAGGLLLQSAVTPAPTTGANVAITPAIAKPATTTPAPPKSESVVSTAPAAAATQTALAAPAGSVVCIDAGHQGSANNSLEPVGPGATERKPKVSSGTAGVATRTHESVLNLKVAKKLRSELVGRGVKVVMVRESEKVDISNSERAQIANDAKADLFIRLHCDGSTDRSRKGLSTLIPAKNKWTGPILVSSKAAGKMIHAAVVAASGAIDRGVVTRSDLSGFNWSNVPTVLVEMGFMSNAAEDRALNTDAYQDKLARGLADGIVEYLRSRQ